MHPRVEKVGPARFGVVCFDCHKAASKWMLADFYGKVLVEPTRVAAALFATPLLIVLRCSTARIG